MISTDLRRVDHRDALLRRKPQTPVVRLHTGRLRAAIRLAVPKSIAFRIARRVDARDFPIGEGVELFAIDPEDAAVGAHPETAEVIFEDLMNHFIEEAIAGSV